MARLAIVSTYNENCGNASYTHVLKTGFSEFVEVDVLPLDLFLLQRKGSAFTRAGDAHIRAMAATLRTYDYVNIQFEAGLFGRTVADVRRRIGWLIEAAPNLILTMHRVDVDSTSRWHAAWLAIRARSFKPWKRRAGSKRYVDLYRGIIEQVGREAKHKNAWIKVHTKRERRIITDIYQMPHCFDYPLAFLTPEERDAAWAQSDMASFHERNGFGPDDKIVGLFGYISEYKGIETAVQALLELPPEYKLVFFGSHHPQSIQAHSAVHPFIDKLIKLVDEVVSAVDARERGDSRVRAVGKPIESLDEAGRVMPLPATVSPPPRLSARVRFVGNLPDAEFIEALRLSDAVVLPYIEVGQSMSGVIVLGMEAGAKLVCANNHSFAETRRYFGDTFLGFDIGNYVELAQKVQHAAAQPERSTMREARDQAYARYNIAGSIKAQLDHFQHVAEKNPHV
ncbi:hypothetical protein [Sphingomonas sp. CARO-RG-8B-R24-01]|uniref:hypothetical protein n=1 Tax=Sphingomonas sp. CARO-RG-8B-R24-01 TaxID=2914831 RepID=UPI001F593606|nr:hypothetical protein [Sphingomonas sp. CARO-RG-8B-R24-01]